MDLGTPVTAQGRLTDSGGSRSQSTKDDTVVVWQGHEPDSFRDVRWVCLLGGALRTPKGTPCVSCFLFFFVGGGGSTESHLNAYLRAGSFAPANSQG